MAAGGYELKPGVSPGGSHPERGTLPDADRAAVRHPVQIGPARPTACGSARTTLSDEVAAHYLPSTRPPYAWYIRIPDLPAFIRRIAPALERRLASSNWVGWNGDLHIGFYRSGWTSSSWMAGWISPNPGQPTPADDGIAGFPELTFFELLLGRRSFAELRYAYPDCWGKDELYDLFDTLFPRRSTDLFGIS